MTSPIADDAPVKGVTSRVPDVAGLAGRRAAAALKDPVIPPDQIPPLDVSAGHLPTWSGWGFLAGAVVVSLLVQVAIGGFNPTGFVALTLLVYLVVTYAVSRAVEGSRKALDRIVTGLVVTAFIVALLPLISVVITVVVNGSQRFDGEFFTSSLRGVVGAGGGAQHAIAGTLIITGLATLISVPVGLLTSIYLVEYGQGRLKQAITFFVDVMTGIPSIVAGLFAFALFLLITGDAGYNSGFAGAIALSVLMIPVVVRSCEEILKLVPDELREASFALGVPRWLTITKVVIPTAIAGIATGITIAIARVIGETAPLLIVAGLTKVLNANPFEGKMATLPVYIFYQYTQPGAKPEASQDRAWTAALVLIVIVMLLNLIARLISRFFAPKTGR